MIVWLDKDGYPITAGQWEQLKSDIGYFVVAKDTLRDVDGVEVGVSTVWLGINHNFTGVGPPLIFETMIFGGRHDLVLWRYPTEVAALAGHDQVMAMLRDE